MTFSSTPGPLGAQSRDADGSVNIRVPEGFHVTQFAGDDLAHDIFCMTIDSRGRVVVSGPGYVRILLDEDGDGRAESARQFADGPETGAQGMFFHGRNLVCLGDAGLIGYRDRDGDDRADGEPNVFLQMKTGGEHHAHAVRRGPDGWWYLIAGNHAGVGGQYATLDSSPIQRPEAGVLLRLQPDLSGGEIVADGFRNSYDFAFTQQGDVFNYDSDGERDVSLPWYRPTRVFHVLPASNAGWVSRSWKKANGFFEVPPVLAELGRGSPTGVVCYRHRQFPQRFRNAVFVLDWTFGRVLALPLKRNGAGWSSKPIPFMTATGNYGFAPTDVAVGPDGSLYVCVGGRGTRGGVFRVTYGEGDSASGAVEPFDPETQSAEQKLSVCLTAPQPLSSWSRARWKPLAEKLGPEPFLEAAGDPSHSAAMRKRALEILTEMFGGVPGDALRRLSRSDSAEVRARAAWAWGRSDKAGFDTDLIRPFLRDADPLVVRFALEALLRPAREGNLDHLLAPLASRLGDDRRSIRQSAARVAGCLPEADYDRLLRLAQPEGPSAVLSAMLGRLSRRPAVDPKALRVGLQVLEDQTDPTLRRDAVRLMQLALGDVGPGGADAPPVLDGYTSRLPLAEHEQTLKRFRPRLSELYPTGNPREDYELARLLAMLAPDDPGLLDRILDQISEASHPVGDIHHLIVAARLPAARNRKQRNRIADALIRIEPKIVRRDLNRDSNWDDRLGELYQRLVRHDPALPGALVRHERFGRPGHILFLSEIGRDALPDAITAFVQRIRSAGDDYPWTTDVVFLLGESDRPEHRELVRQQFEKFALRGAVLMVLAEKPSPRDRAKFVAGLQSSSLEVLSACLKALDELPPADDAAEQVALLKTLRRLGTGEVETRLRDRVVRLLRRNTGKNFGYRIETDGGEPQNEAIERWTAWIRERYPDEADRQFASPETDLEDMKALLAKVDWSAGDPSRGRELFEKRSCARCHGGRRALGPDLAGVARRFSREDLFTAIAAPDRDVSPRYQTTLIQTTGGRVYTGLVVYQSVDGLILRNAAGQTFRIEGEEIEVQRKLDSSLMPRKLLEEFSPEDAADLYAYLSTLGDR